jgi:hypothetical protein
MTILSNLPRRGLSGEAAHFIERNHSEQVQSLVVSWGVV